MHRVFNILHNIEESRSLHWCDDTFTNNNAVWVAGVFLFFSFDPNLKCTEPSKIQGFLFVSCTEKGRCCLCAQAKFELLQMSDTAGLTFFFFLRAASCTEHRGCMFRRRRVPLSYWEDGAYWALRSSEAFVSKLD